MLASTMVIRPDIDGVGEEDRSGNCVAIGVAGAASLISTSAIPISGTKCSMIPSRDEDTLNFLSDHTIQVGIDIFWAVASIRGLRTYSLYVFVYRFGTRSSSPPSMSQLESGKPEATR